MRNALSTPGEHIEIAFTTISMDEQGYNLFTGQREREKEREGER